MSLWKPEKIEEYIELQRWIDSLKEKKLPNGQPSWSEWTEVSRWYAKNDLFYLLNFIATDGSVIHSQTGKPFHFHEYYLQMCRNWERQRELSGGVDFSARGSAKSTVRTKLGSIQLLLTYPDIAIFIFSATLKLGQKHLRLIMDELTQNKVLIHLFEDVLWQDPIQAVKDGKTLWSVDSGIRVKRTMIRSVNTVEVHAAMGTGGPVGTRPDVVIADDIEHGANVNSPENIAKLKESFSQMVSLLTPVAVPKALLFITNTRFNQGGLVEDKMQEYLIKNPEKVRGVPAEDLNQPGDGPLGGTALYPFTTDVLWQKYEESRVKSEYALQFALDYSAAEDARLGEENIQWYDEDRAVMGKGKTAYICIDASRGVHDPTAIWVWGLGSDKRYYWLDAVCRKMDPSKPYFHDEIFVMVQKWSNLSDRVVEVRVEQMGGSVWADLIRKELQARGCAVPVVACTSHPMRTGNFSTGKAERIFQRWSPMLSAGLVCFPLAKSKNGAGILSADENGVQRCLVDYFLNVELKVFPRSKFDDMMDAGALIHDDKANKERPLQWPLSDKQKDKYKRIRGFGPRFSWMSA